MTVRCAYDLGKYTALRRLNLLTKSANVGKYVLPALGGGALGAGTGALAAPQGEEMSSALLGAGLGAGAGGAGKAVARSIPKARASAAKRSHGKLLDEFSGPGGSIDEFGELRPSEIEQLQALESKMNLKPTASQEAIGSGIGAGAGAIGAAAAASSSDQDEKPYPRYMDPYGYSQYR